MVPKPAVSICQWDVTPGAVPADPNLVGRRSRHFLWKSLPLEVAAWWLFNFSAAPKKLNLVEVPGIEPGSVSSPPSALHAYFVYCLTFHWPDKQGLKGELALVLTALTTSGVWQRSHESCTRFEYMGTSAPGQAKT